jgi:hypothetical protein
VPLLATALHFRNASEASVYIQYMNKTVVTFQMIGSQFVQKFVLLQ